jgi:hypothetical protein
MGCNTTPSKPTLMANTAKQELSVYQLRAIDYEYAARFAQLVAATSQEIVENTSDTSVREHALQWRLWAMPQARSAAFDQDPLAGFLELWVLAVQQRDHFTDGAGKSVFGTQQEVAVATARHLEREIEELAATVLTDDNLERIRDVVHEWSGENPIEGQLYVRPTARADLASFFSPEHHGGLKAVGSMEETVRDISDRISILSSQVPFEVRWQAEYLIEALFEERVHDRIDSIVGSLDEFTGFLDSFEGTLSAQTQALLSGIEQERITIFTAVENERTAIVEAIEGERRTVLDKLDSQMNQASERLETVGRGLIDHFFTRLIQILVISGIVVFLIVLLVLAVVRRRTAEAIDPNPPTE